MNDGKTQEVRYQDSQASRSLGAVLAEAFGSVLRFATAITRSAPALLAWNGGWHPVRLPVAVPGPHPDRPPGLGASRS